VTVIGSLYKMKPQPFMYAMMSQVHIRFKYL